MLKTLKSLNLPSKYPNGRFDVNDNTLLKPKYYVDPINCDITPTNANQLTPPMFKVDHEKLKYTHYLDTMIKDSP